MRKKIIAFLLVAAIVIGIAPLMSLAEEGDTVTAVRGDCTYALTADPDTGTVPDGFGTISNNGRIWTDKSVEIVDDSFSVNLKVLAQEYISSMGSTVTSSIAADVVMIFDLTNSMIQTKNNISKENGSSVTRLEALVDSANQAIDIITNTNPNNRIVVYGYYGEPEATDGYTTKCIEMLPLAHYSSSSTSTGTVGKYLEYRYISSSKSAVDYSANLLKDGEPFTNGNSGRLLAETGMHTDTQYGIAASIDGLVGSISDETDHSVRRKPYVILLTDGEASWANHRWYSNNLEDLDSKYRWVYYKDDSTGESSSGGRPQECIAALTILTAAHRKDKLEEAYTIYNNGKSSEVDWFNIGLGVTEPTSPDNASTTACLLDPNYLAGIDTGTESTRTTRQWVKYLMGRSGFAPDYTEKDYMADDNYVYIHNGDGYVTFANTYAVLMNAFTTLAEIIQHGSQEYTIPIVNHEGSGEASGDVVFTDVIGEGMFITDITLKPDGNSPVTGEDPDEDGVYTFHGYDTTVTVTEDMNGQQTLVWSLPATEVAMFTFADRENVDNGEYISAEPTTLTYGVDFTNDIEEGPAYTNAFDENNVPLTTVTYEIPGDNDYYFNVTTDNAFNFVSSTMKTDNDSTAAKTENVTETAPDYGAYTYTAENDGTADSSATVEGRLGNNGKVTFLSRKNEVEITVEKKWEDSIGNPIDDTSSLPPVTVTLLRKVAGSENEETVRYIQLSNFDGYSETYTLPVRDNNNNKYIYSIEEDCPDGYYIADISKPVQASDCTLTVTNRAFPEKGIVAVRKQWKNKIGAVITDTTLPEIQMQLKRHVAIEILPHYTVTISVQGEEDRVLLLVPGSTISFNLTFYCNKKNQANGRISLNGEPIPTTPTGDNDSVNDRDENNQSHTFWPAKATNLQTFTVNRDLTLSYTYSKTLSTYSHPNYPCVVYTEKHEAEEGDSITEYGDDQVYDTFSLSTSTGWQKVYDDLVITEVGDNGEIYTYKYFIEEVSDVPGFAVSYSDNNTNGVEGGLLTVTNTSTSNIAVLPETGGRGSPPVVLTGALTAMVATAIMFFGLSPGRRKKKNTKQMV